MSRFRKKPVVIEATRWFVNGDHPDDRVGEMVDDPMGGRPYRRLEGQVVRFFRHPDVPGFSTCIACGVVIAMHDHGWIDTPEGGHTVCPGDWIVTEGGEYYPCKPDVFDAAYESVIT